MLTGLFLLAALYIMYLFVFRRFLCYSCSKTTKQLFLSLFFTELCELNLTLRTLTHAGVSVCLRYLTDNQQASIFTLSPSSGTPLRLAVNGMNKYGLTFDRYSYYRLFLEPNIWFWPNIGPDIWNRVCLTVDTVKNVAQVFSGSSISIRKMLPLQVRTEYHIQKRVLLV